MPTIATPTLNVGGPVTATIVTAGTSATTTGYLTAIGQQAAVDLKMYSTAANAECFVMSSGLDAASVMRKMAVLAFVFTDRNATTGYASANVHCTKIVGGVAQDEYAWCAWGGKGMTIFPNNILAADAPGLGRLKVNGNLDVATNLVVTASISGLRSSNATEINLQLTNSTAGTAAVTRIQLGNSGSAYASTIDVFSSGHATKANYLEIMNQFNAPLILGTNGVGVLTLDSAGAARFTKLVGSTQYTLTDAATVAIDWTNGNNQRLVSPAAGRTFTFASARAGDHLTISIVSAGVVVHTWPATVKWTGGGTVPTISASGKEDTFVFYYNGTNYIGSALLNA